MFFDTIFYKGNLTKTNETLNVLYNQIKIEYGTEITSLSKDIDKRFIEIENTQLLIYEKQYEKDRYDKD